MFIDVSQQESAVALIGGEVLAYQLTGEEPLRRGNRSPYHAPQNAYPCAGDDRWITIAITNSQQWRALAELVGGPGLSGDPRFATNEQRLADQDKLDDIISSWTSGQDTFELTEQLQKSGVPASPVLRGPDLLEDPQYIERETFITVDHPQVGPKKYPGIPWKMSATPGKVNWASPALGQHNSLIYGELLGLSPQEISGLEEQGVIGTKPTGSRIV